MKKILTLVVALVMVFAIAAPALAITGDLTPDETAAKSAPVSLDVQLFNAPEALGYGGLALSQIAANKAYIVNEMAFWGIAMNFGKAPLTMAASDYTGAALTLTTDAITLNTVVTEYTQNGAADVVKAAASLLTIADNKGTVTAGDLDAFFANAVAPQKVFFFGSGLVKAKGVLKAELKKAPVWPFVINNADGPLYTISNAEANTFTVTDFKVPANHVDFVVDPETDFVTAINVNNGPVLFYVPVSNGGSVVKSINGIDAGEDGFDALNKVYTGVMSFFGFNYDAEGRLLAKHFESKFSGLYLKDEAVVNLYTADIVVPGGVVPPKTGDSASIVGFAMIVLAMVACGVVVSRKVRA